MAVIWIGLSVLILIGTYISFPLIADITLKHIIQFEGLLSGTNLDMSISTNTYLYAIATLILEVFAIAFASFILGRSALIEIEIANRFYGLADALCIAGRDFGQLEKAIQLFVPKAKYISVPELISSKNISALLDIVKETKKIVI
jgi:hypothetical protein